MEKAHGRKPKDPTENLFCYDDEMQNATEGYAAFVMEHIKEAQKHCADSLVCVEQIARENGRTSLF